MLNLDQFKQLLTELAPRRTPILSVSGPGLGKTAVHRQAAGLLSATTQKPWGYHSLVLSNFDPFDIPGYMVPQRYQDGSLRAEYTEPFFWRQIADWDGVNQFGILHLDEVGDAEMAMQKLAAQIVFDRRVGTRYLPDGCWVLLSSNRLSDKSGVHRRATMFQNRLDEIELIYNSDVHMKHMQSVSFHPIGLSFIHQEFGSLYTGVVPTDPGPFMTPRSFEEGVRDLVQLGTARGMPSHQLPNDAVAQAVMSGRIGAGATAQWQSHMKYAAQLPTMDEIALNPGKAKVPDALGGQYIVSFMIGQQAQEKQLPSIMQYFSRMAVEMQTITMRMLTDRNRKGDLSALFSAPGVTDWCRKHSDVVLASV